MDSEKMCKRLHELSHAVTLGPDDMRREFTMRIPVDLERDADVVLSAAADRIAALEAQLAEREAECEHWRNSSKAHVSRVLYEDAVEEQKARAESAEATLATVRDELKRAEGGQDAAEEDARNFAIQLSAARKAYEDEREGAHHMAGVVLEQKAALAAAREENERLRNAEKSLSLLRLAMEETFSMVEADAALRARTDDAGQNLPDVGGSYVEGTLNGLAHRAQVHLGIEQEKALPDNALIAVLCDTVRLVREWKREVEGGVEVALRSRSDDAIACEECLQRDANENKGRRRFRADKAGLIRRVAREVFPSGRMPDEWSAEDVVREVLAECDAQDAVDPVRSDAEVPEVPGEKKDEQDQ